MIISGVASQSHHTGIETNIKPFDDQELLDSQSHHTGIETQHKTRVTS